MPRGRLTAEKWRFALPGNWEPEGVRCVLVPCPDDPEYLAILTGHIAGLTYSQMFDRDETRLGAATVARTWRDALATQYLRFVGCEDMRLRQSPDDSCLLEQSLDGGTTWIPAFDYGACQSLSLSPTPVSPMGNDAAANVFRWTTMLVTEVDTLIDGGATRQQTIDGLHSWLSTWVQTQPSDDALGHLFDVLQPIDRAPYMETDECIGIGPWRCWRQCFDDNGHWLENWADNIANCLEGGADFIIKTLNAFALWLLQNDDLARITIPTLNGGGGGAAGFGSNCPWGFEYDLTMYPAGTFSSVRYPLQQALWLQGHGWCAVLPTIVGDCPGNDLSGAFEMSFPPTKATHLYLIQVLGPGGGEHLHSTSLYVRSYPDGVWHDLVCREDFNADWTFDFGLISTVGMRLYVQHAADLKSVARFGLGGYGVPAQPYLQT